MGTFQSSSRSGLQRDGVLEFVSTVGGAEIRRGGMQQRDMTYSAPLKVTLRLIVFDLDDDTGQIREGH